MNCLLAVCMLSTDVNFGVLIDVTVKWRMREWTEICNLQFVSVHLIKEMYYSDCADFNPELLHILVL